jgi:hypothetical protein
MHLVPLPLPLVPSSPQCHLVTAVITDLSTKFFKNHSYPLLTLHPFTSASLPSYFPLSTHTLEVYRVQQQWLSPSRHHLKAPWVAIACCRLPPLFGYPLSAWVQ